MSFSSEQKLSSISELHSLQIEHVHVACNRCKIFPVHHVHLSYVVYNPAPMALLKAANVSASITAMAFAGVPCVNIK